ncbi:hypothetical protein BJ508DRAFT_325927 [Ascobolus immersus RN42]|uniref:Uncharacterized protein n=1 Tax=Ascobolus immersus RN42 TaxID=1160509 RepID=A0A3N4IJU4_ASCIM|nr:hypothetical protein BJ508DRAFT_325927 [Ascobolus immersus RN42]
MPPSQVPLVRNVVRTDRDDEYDIHFQECIGQIITSGFPRAAYEQVCRELRSHGGTAACVFEEPPVHKHIANLAMPHPEVPDTTVHGMLSLNYRIGDGGCSGFYLQEARPRTGKAFVAQLGYIRRTGQTDVLSRLMELLAGGHKVFARIIPFSVAAVRSRDGHHYTSFQIEWRATACYDIHTHLRGLRFSDMSLPDDQPSHISVNFDTVPGVAHPL